ncbi:MAG: MBL fold metallo-hydrolase [Bacteroidia bacterium]|nr:MBL fold metallo-hydrolase [Bacteroidia bacterium]
MKKINLYLFLFIGLLFCIHSGFAQLPAADIIPTKKGDLSIQPVFHGSLVLTLGQKTLYVDPYNGANAYKTLKTPDLILITDIHQDHMDTTTLNALNTSNTKLIVPQAVADLLPSKYKDKIVVLNNGQTVNLFDISIMAIPMYNLPEDETSRHTKGRGNGYILTFGGKRIYISGDTEDIPEMRSLKKISVAFVCMNQPFTMTIEQAASAVLEFKPKIIYPYHFRGREGLSDVEAFKTMVAKDNPKIDVRLRDWYVK